jgi:hypothetical protein
MERLALGDDRPERKDPTGEAMASVTSAPTSRMVMLPGEVLQAQMES